MAKKEQEIQDEIDRQTFRENELDANKTLAVSNTGTAIVLAFALVLAGVYFFVVKHYTFLQFLPDLISFVLVSLFLFTSRYWEKMPAGKKVGFKYFLLFQSIVVIGLLNVLFPKHAILSWAACIVMASQYYDQKVTKITFFTTLAAVLVCIYLGMLFGEFDPNLFGTIGLTSFVDGDKSNTYAYISSLDQYVLDKDMTLHFRMLFLQEHPNRWWQVAVYFYLPRAACLTIVYLAVYALTKRTRALLKTQCDEMREHTKTNNELRMATEIQTNNLPKDFPSNEYIDLFALMDPAKEVGGDFYDFFYITDTKLGLVIGDVSGKGVPAALFMMKTESLIKSLAMTFKEETNNVLRRVNYSLCEGNFMNMFVTCWFGILDVSTGKLSYTSAGHNPPIIKHNGKFEYLKGKVGFVLGGLNETRYIENEIQLNPGDKIFLYTDGVTEAHNVNNQLYSESRLLDIVKNNDTSKAIRLVKTIREDISNFAGEAPQFDDITMLECDFIAANKSIINDFVATRDNTNAVLGFTEDTLNNLNATTKAINSILVAVEEIYVNIASYAYAPKDGKMTLQIKDDGASVVLTFIDEGKPFNPLDCDDPNIAATADERGIGGLGIFMVKKMMDEVNYEYRNHQNILTMKKKIK